MTNPVPNAVVSLMTRATATLVKVDPNAERLTNAKGQGRALANLEHRQETYEAKVQVT